MKIICNGRDALGTRFFTDTGEDITDDLCVSSLKIEVRPPGFVEATLVCYLDGLQVEVDDEGVCVYKFDDIKRLAKVTSEHI